MVNLRNVLPTAPPGNSNDANGPFTNTHTSFDTIFTKGVMIGMACIICALIILILYCCCCRRSPVANSDDHRGGRNNQRPLRQIPMVPYASNINISGTHECTICLDEFKEGVDIEVGVLPDCKHGFHVKCIDKWLSTETTCPICRRSLPEV